MYSDNLAVAMALCTVALSAQLAYIVQCSVVRQFYLYCLHMLLDIDLRIVNAVFNNACHY